MLLYFVFFSLVSLSIHHVTSPYPVCSNKNIDIVNGRKLYVATCETLGTQAKPRYSSIGFLAGDPLKLWNISSVSLRKNGLRIANICAGISWELGVLTKTVAFYQYVNELLLKATVTDVTSGKLYVLFMDSDTLWTVENEADIWQRFDCARGSSKVLISSEMTCSMGGFYCTKDTISGWYPNISKIDSASCFLNSGVFMGEATVVRGMLEYALLNNKSYYSYHAFDNKWRYHDQHAMSDYVLRVAPTGLIAIDYYQQLSASFGVRLPSNKSTKSKFVCKRLDGSVDFHCEDATMEIAKQKVKHFRMNSSSCAVYRQSVNGQLGYSQLSMLSFQPAIWHGNGGSKKLFISLGKEVYECLLRKLGTLG